MSEINEADRDAAKEALLVRNLFGREQTYEETAGCLAQSFAAHREAERERIVRMLDGAIEHFQRLNAERSGNAEQELFTTGSITALGIVKQAIVEPAKLAALIAAFGIEVGVEHG